LLQAGFDVITAPNGVEGLARLYESYPDLVILAEELPWVNTMKLCSRLRQAYAVPLIVVGDDPEGSSPLLEARTEGCDCEPANGRALPTTKERGLAIHSYDDHYGESQNVN